MPKTEEAAVPHADYPVIVVAWKSLGSRLPEGDDKRLTEDWQSVGDLLAYIDGHGDHGGWAFDKATQVMTCKGCGEPMYEVGDPVTAETAVA